MTSVAGRAAGVRRRPQRVKEGPSSSKHVSVRIQSSACAAAGKLRVCMCVCACVRGCFFLHR